ncbi:MAG: lysophospholipid acyltransferase family protein [Halieaceae bacterium]|jgi:1-acyl-sn-glycerol-3-phosphate acyltransferase
MGFLRSSLVFLWMALTVIPLASLIILATPFSSADARWWYIARPWLRGAIGAVRLIGRVDYTVSGEEWLPDSNDNQRIILCPKHQSTWETFFFASRMPHPLAYVFKRELLFIPFFGWAMACLNMIHIDRSARGEAWNKVASLGERLMDRGKWVIMFPEGTRSERGKSGSYKTGAARLSIATNARIVPIAVSSGRCWPRKSFRFIPGTIAVSIGQPISPRMGESSADLMERVSLWIEDEMRRIDPDAYPESERPPDARREEAALSQALEERAAAARAAQGGVVDDQR